MFAGVRLAFTVISADKLKKTKFKKNSIWHIEANVPPHQGPLAPCLVRSSRGDSLLRLVVPPAVHQ